MPLIAALLWSGTAAARTQATAPGAGAFPWPDGARAAVSLTFDDARPSQVDVGLPVFDRHGVKVTVQRDTAAATDVGNVILSRAADAAADLVVMGIYGHSRMREFVLGGASRTLLASMTVPLLIAH